MSDGLRALTGYARRAASGIGARGDADGMADESGEPDGDRYDLAHRRTSLGDECGGDRRPAAERAWDGDPTRDIYSGRDGGSLDACACAGGVEDGARRRV